MQPHTSRDGEPDVDTGVEFGVSHDCRPGDDRPTRRSATLTGATRGSNVSARHDSRFDYLTSLTSDGASVGTFIVHLPAIVGENVLLGAGQVGVGGAPANSEMADDSADPTRYRA